MTELVERLNAIAKHANNSLLRELGTEVIAELTTLRQQLEAAQANEARYLWLINSGKYAPAMHCGGWGLRIGGGVACAKYELDTAIDQAMKELPHAG